MTQPFDVLVVGSGFGGAIVACRLAEAGYRVVVTERGRRWEPGTFPRAIGDPWLWDQAHPERAHGWLDLRMFRRVAVAQGAGVGGGSLIYANVSIEAEPETFASGWPPEITHDELRPRYDTVARMLDVQRIPRTQWAARTALMREAAERIGHADRFGELDLAVTFDPDWSAAGSKAYDPARSKRFVNLEGREQGTCVHLGECSIGCPVLAKNTLDLNYLARAEAHGADVRPLTIARSIGKTGDGYEVRLERIENGERRASVETARVVVVAAGSLGSTELLLRSRDVAKTLPGLPRALGRGWSTNGDFLTIGWHGSRDVEPTRGPTITSAIDFSDGSAGARPFIIEDGGFPDLLAAYRRGRHGRFSPWRRRRLLDASVRALLEGGGDAVEHVMPWFSQGRDAADGVVRLRPRWWLFGEPQLTIDWNVETSRPVIESIIAMHRRLAEATDGRPIVPATWRLASYLITPHPLGGCRMGSSAADSVVDHRGEVWGHRNLFVADGAIIPTAIGRNPSRTIAALAERIAAGIASEGR
ncbi:MAG TPA: GMC family oxidoreductase [Clostridia bacterium]|nr:GMC family oxidoreductase [Clostridia bacterium]